MSSVTNGVVLQKTIKTPFAKPILAMLHLHFTEKEAYLLLRLLLPLYGAPQAAIADK